MHHVWKNNGIMDGLLSVGIKRKGAVQYRQQQRMPQASSTQSITSSQASSTQSITSSQASGTQSITSSQASSTQAVPSRTIWRDL